MNLGGGAASEDHPTSTVSRWRFTLSQRIQHLLDKSTPHVKHRWIFLAVLALIYIVRVYVLQGFYVITYGLGIYIIQLLIAFLSPQVDPEIEAITAVNMDDNSDGPALPTRSSDEFRPFVRRLPEFKFWYSLVKGICFAFVLTFFDALDVPVFWPILVMYWLVLFISTMKRQIMHMIKYKYVPFTFASAKQRYGVTNDSPSDEP